MSIIHIYTIGFTKKSAERFFFLLENEDIDKIIDTRLNSNSQLAGFSKRDDLQFFLKKVLGIEYIQMPELAPTKDILDQYRKKIITWKEYKAKYKRLIESRKIEYKISRESLDKSCLLCSEDKPFYCHRKIAAEYLMDKWGAEVKIKHLY